MIADVPTGDIRAIAEATHRARITDWDVLETAERETRSFIIDTFDKAWYSELYEPVNFYSLVTTRQMLEHLQGICVNNHEIDILDFQDKMRVMHIEHESIAQYIWVLEEAQQQAARMGLPITDETLVMIAKKTMLATHQFPTTTKKGEDIRRSAQTRGKWKELYKKS